MKNDYHLYDIIAYKHEGDLRVGAIVKIEKHIEPVDEEEHGILEVERIFFLMDNGDSIEEYYTQARIDNLAKIQKSLECDA
jgi:hypothetical protein